MRKARYLILLLVLAGLAVLCVGFGREFLRGGDRAGFVLSYLGFVAVASFLLVSVGSRWRPWLLVGAYAGLLGPALALVLVAGAESGALAPEEELLRKLASLMAILWYPGNWISSVLGMEVRLNDLHITRREEIFEWLRLVPMNAFIYSLLALAARFMGRGLRSWLTRARER